MSRALRGKGWTPLSIAAVALAVIAWLLELVALALTATLILACLAMPVFVLAWLCAVAGLVCGVIAIAQRDQHGWAGILPSALFFIGNIALLAMGAISGARWNY